MTPGRWLPALGVVIGASLMVAAVALGQPANPVAPPHMAAGPGGDDQSPMARGWDRGDRGWRFRRMDPEQTCKRRFAREAGFLAYMGALLELTTQQEPLWDKYHQAMLDSATKLRQVCLDNLATPPWDQTALQRRDRMEKMLTARLDALHATRPALDALYQSLTPEQRAVLDRPRDQRRSR
jgi:Spy/CpxP family protein refolding chaperone